MNYFCLTWGQMTFLFIYGRKMDEEKGSESMNSVVKQARFIFIFSLHVSFLQGGCGHLGCNFSFWKTDGTKMAKLLGRARFIGRRSRGRRKHMKICGWKRKDSCSFVISSLHTIMKKGMKERSLSFLFVHFVYNWFEWTNWYENIPSPHVPRHHCLCSFSQQIVLPGSCCRWTIASSHHRKGTEWLKEE